jgi:hypothetical protein
MRTAAITFYQLTSESHVNHGIYSHRITHANSKNP